MNWRIPVAEPLLGEEEQKAVSDVVASGRISQGERVTEFEGKIAAYLGRKYAVACHSGTCANEAMLMSLFEPKDFLKSFNGVWVAVPACTSVAVSNPILTVHGQPDFIDLDRKLCMNIEKVKDFDKAILATYEYGSSPERFDLLLESSIPVLEDACVALGSECNGRKLGTFGLAASLSFYVNKLITCGEGGMVVTNDERIATYCREYVNHGRKQSQYHEEWYYYHYGRNAKMTDLQAAIGLVQLGKIQRFIDARKKIARAIHASIKGDVRYDSLKPSDDEVPWYYWIVNWDGSVNMKEKSAQLQKDYGVETRPTMPVLPRIPFYNMQRNYPVAEASQNGFLVGCQPAILEHGDLGYLCESVSTVLGIK